MPKLEVELDDSFDGARSRPIVRGSVCGAEGFAMVLAGDIAEEDMARLWPEVIRAEVTLDNDPRRIGSPSFGTLLLPEATTVLRRGGCGKLA